MKEKEVELKKLEEEGLIKVGMHSFLPINEILLDPKTDHDLRFFPSMLRSNTAGNMHGKSGDASKEAEEWKGPPSAGALQEIKATEQPPH